MFALSHGHIHTYTRVHMHMQVGTFPEHFRIMDKRLLILSIKVPMAIVACPRPYPSICALE